MNFKLESLIFICQIIIIVGRFLVLGKKIKTFHKTQEYTCNYYNFEYNKYKDKNKGR